MARFDWSNVGFLFAKFYQLRDLLASRLPLELEQDDFVSVDVNSLLDATLMKRYNLKLNQDIKKRSFMFQDQDYFSDRFVVLVLSQGGWFSHRNEII